MTCRHCEALEKVIDDLLWAIDHQSMDSHAREASAITLRARAHNADWHDARAMHDRLARGALGEYFNRLADDQEQEIDLRDSAQDRASCSPKQ